MVQKGETGSEAGTATGTEVVVPREGAPEVLVVARQRTSGDPKAGEGVVRRQAAGVSFAEVQMLKGRYFNQPKFPFVPGYDLVGIVEGVGEGVDDGLIGRRGAALPGAGGGAGRGGRG